MRYKCIFIPLEFFFFTVESCVCSSLHNNVANIHQILVFLLSNELERKNFKSAGDILCKVWSEMTLDGNIIKEK